MNQVYTVSQLNSYIKGMFQSDMSLAGIAIQGEVSNCTYHSSGHIYFTLKDKGSRIACVMFAGNRRGLDFTMRDGMSIVAIGTVGVYERDGKYQLYASRIMKEGYGELYEKLELLKKKLLEEGLFNDVYKKKIPYYSKKIGIVTAQTGAAIQDIINISSRRNPYVQLYLYPALVQGEGAAESIAAGIRYLDKMDMDVLIVGRGGGSFEDLFAFNEEVVVRAIYECETPVISAVGHEVDTTLSDYVADLRAPTPSAAAELAVISVSQIYERISEYRRILNNCIQAQVNEKRHAIDAYAAKLKYVSPEMQLQNKRMYAAELENRLNNIMNDKMKAYKNRLILCAEKLKVLSPLHRLSGGYSYVTDAAGNALESISSVEEGDNIIVTLKDGNLEAIVDKVRK